MSADRWLLLIVSALSWYATGQIWIVQMSCYPLWPKVGQREFAGYHLAWWHSIWGVIFLPAGLLLAGAIGLLWLRPPGVNSGLLWAGLGLQIALYVSTAAWWGPLMARLAKPEIGLLPDRYQLLIKSHWLRVAIVTAHAVVMVLMLMHAMAAGSRA